MNNAKKSGPNVAVVGLAFLAIGFAAGYIAAGQSKWNAGYEAGKAAALAEAQPGGPPPTSSSVLPRPIEDGGIRTIGGTVVSVGEDRLVIDAQLLIEGAPTRRTVLVTSDTRIVRVSEKTPAEFEKERQEFQRQMEAYRLAEEKAAKEAALNKPAVALPEPPLPPRPNTETVIALKDIKEGEWVTVSADTDITRAAQFTATTIAVQTAIQPNPPLPPTAPPTN